MTDKDSAQSEPAVRIVRLRPRPWALDTKDVSPEAAEAEYRACRASLELKFRDDINSWWNEMYHDPPRSALGELIEPLVIVGFQSAVFTYLETEMENFAALLLNRGMTGGEGIQAIRAHATEVIAGVLEYHWRPQLSSVGVSEETIENNCPHPNLTQAYEEMFWKAETDFGGAVALWSELTNNPDPIFGSTVLESVNEPTEAITGDSGTATADEDRHALLVEKLKRYIKTNKLSGGVINSKAAFLRSLRNNRGMDRQSLARWEKRLPTLSPGHAAIIEAAIEKLPEESPTSPTLLLH